MKRYPYKYEHHDAGTIIKAKDHILKEMLSAYRRAKGIKPLQSLAERGVFYASKYGRSQIIISHPDSPTVSKEEVRDFPHRQIADEITTAWRNAQEFLEFWKSTGLTQKELAKVLGCSQSAISEWKDGKRTIPKKTLIIIRLMQENQQLKA